MIKGVTFNDTWDGAVDPNDYVLDPVSQLEWVIRKQKNIDITLGKDICLNGYGSFRSASLTQLKNKRSSRELLTETELTTKYIINSLCKEFFMIHWHNGDGQECVEYVFKPRVNEFSFTFDEIYDISTIKLPQKNNIYVEPIINYAYDYATQKFTKQLRVLGVTTEAVWNPDLTPGFTDLAGAKTWNKCKSLYNHYGHYEPMPDEISNKLWITEDVEAEWWVNKFYGLDESGFQDWQRCTIDVGYYDALYVKNIDIGMIGTINLPHQTNGVNTQVMIESITPKKRAKLVSLDIILLDNIIDPPNDLIIEGNHQVDTITEGNHQTDTITEG